MRIQVCTMALTAGTLAACSSTQETYLPTGQKGHVVSCTPGWTGGVVGAVANASTSWNQCYQKAGEIRGARGYKILQQTGENGVYGQAGQGGGFVSTTNNRSMMIQCNDEGAPAAAQSSPPTAAQAKPAKAN